MLKSQHRFWCSFSCKQHRNRRPSRYCSGRIN